jgi:hypothetical protein
MKPVSDWKFSAALPNVDLGRIITEAGASHGKVAFGVVRIVVDGEFAVLSVVENVRRAGFDGPRPHGYLTNLSKLSRVGTHLHIDDLESPLHYAPAGAVAVFLCATQNEADELVGKLTDRVVVNVEVF